MSRRKPRPAKRKGLSEMVGAVFILVLIGVSAGFALTMFTSFTGYQKAVDTRAQYNAELPREQLTYSKVTFGGTATFTPGSGFPSGGKSSAVPATFYPVTNENFTGNSNGWTFTRKYLQTGVFGMSGNYDPITSEGSSSGPGSIFTDFTFNQGSSNTVEAIGNWTTQFTLTLSQVASLNRTGCGVSCSSISFRVGDNLPATFNVHAASGSPVVTAFLQNAQTGNTITLGFNPTPPSNGVWTLFSYVLPTNTQRSFLDCSAGTCAHTQGVYNFILKTDITLKGQSAAASEQRVYFDDTGIKVQLTDFQSITVCPTFLIPPGTIPPLSVTDLTIAVTTSYTSSASQTIYMWDFAQSALTQIDSASIGSTSTTRFVDLGGLAGGASQVQRFIQSSPTTINVSPPGCPSVPISAPEGTLVMQIAAEGQGSFTGAYSSDILTSFYSTSGQFSVSVTNTGSLTVHLVSFWVIGSTGATQFASTLTGSSKFEQWVAPGGSVTFTVTYNWSPGQYNIQLVSGRGNIFTNTATAS